MKSSVRNLLRNKIPYELLQNIHGVLSGPPAIAKVGDLYYDDGSVNPEGLYQLTSTGWITVGGGGPVYGSIYYYAGPCGGEVPFVVPNGQCELNYTQLNGLTDGPFSGIAVNGAAGIITILQDGVYMIDFDAQIQCPSDDVFLKLFIDGAPTVYKGRAPIAMGGITGTAVCNAILNLTTGNILDLRITNPLAPIITNVFDIHFRVVKL